ncbi:MAG: CHAD domain-containing protein [Rhizobium sp.]
MSYRIRPGRSFTAEVRAVAAAQLRLAIASFEEQPDGLHEAIHEARKKYKRVRALYRLIAADAKDFFVRENARLRDTAATLSLVRDATALIETATYLQDHALNPEEETALAHARAALTARRDALAAGEHDLPEKAQAASESCREAIAALSHLTFDDAPRKTARRLARGWRKNLSRARTALAACHTSAHAEVFHELRKSAQTYWMHLSLLRDVWPSAMAAKRAEAKALFTTLGHEHDLALLVALLDSEPGILGGGAELSHLLGVIIRQQQELRRTALHLAEQIFADTPERESMIIEALWTAAATE